MKLNEAIMRVQTLKPSQYSIEDMARWVSDLDSLLYKEVAVWHEDMEETAHGPYDPETDGETELMVPDPYSDIYVKYLIAQIDFYNSEISRYNQSMIMYNSALSAYSDWLNRNHVPKQDYFVRI